MNDQTQDQTQQTTETLANNPEARTQDGTLKDQSQTTQTDTQSQAKAEGDKSAEAKADDKVTAVPEKYEAFKLPEGMQLSEKAAGEASTVFKELGLSQDAAQKLVDFHTAQLKAVVDDAAATYNRTRDEWRGEVLKDPKLAHNGELRPEVKATLSKAIDSLGGELGPKFREALNVTGVGDNPAFVRGFLQFAEKFSEGTLVKAGGPVASKANGSTRQTAAQAMYPNLPSSNG